MKRFLISGSLLISMLSVTSTGVTQTTLANRNWCALSTNASELAAQVCLNKDGVPVPHKSWAEWISNNYFGKFKKHKAFAISDDGWGLSIQMPNPNLAEKMALLDCNLRANEATTCGVVNVNGRNSLYSNHSKSSHKAFSSSGNLSDIAGRYRFEMTGKEWLYDGVLRLEVNGSDIQGQMEVCVESTNCAGYSIDEIHETKRGRFLRATVKKLKTGGGARWPEQLQIAVSVSSDTNSLMGRWSFWAVIKGTKLRN